MSMNDDLKINFDKVGKACKQVGEEWEKMMRENNPFDTISKIAKDISDRKDKEKALEFTKCIGKLLRENGVTPMIEEYRTGGTLKDNKIIEEYYGVAITGLDFKEHDKKFNDEIKQLKHDLDKMTTHHDEFKKEAQDVIAKLESELEVKENLPKIKNGFLANNDELHAGPIEVAQMLINATYKRKNCMTGIEYDKDIYSIDDLEQIAEHLLVYCKHHREE